MNKENIFNLFEEEAVENQHNISNSTVEDLMERAYLKIGMFTKLIINHFTFHKKLKDFFDKEGAKYNADEVREASEIVVYNRAWAYIRKVDVTKESHIKAIKQFEPITFNKALQNSIWFFEDREEYEKCAHLFKIQEVVKTFQNSLD